MGCRLCGNFIELGTIRFMKSPKLSKVELRWTCLIRLLLLMGHPHLSIVVSCGSKNGYQKRRSFESEWTAYLRYLSIPSSIANLDVYDQLMSTTIFTSMLDKIFMWVPKGMRKVVTAFDLDLLIMCFDLQKLWGKWLRPRFGFTNHVFCSYLMRNWRLAENRLH
jgi:hypothetical protein